MVFQSRTMTFIFYSFIILNLILHFRYFFNKKKLLIFSLILPVFFFITYNFSAKFYKGKLNTIENPVLFVIKDSFLRHQESPAKGSPLGLKLDREAYKLERYSSNRFADWKSAITIIKKNNFKGYGAQSDRLFINQSVHNALLYSILSGGIISGLSLLIIYFFQYITF